MVILALRRLATNQFATPVLSNSFNVYNTRTNDSWWRIDWWREDYYPSLLGSYQRQFWNDKEMHQTEIRVFEEPSPCVTSQVRCFWNHSLRVIKKYTLVLVVNAFLAKANIFHLVSRVARLLDSPLLFQLRVQVHECRIDMLFGKIPPCMHAQIQQIEIYSLLDRPLY